MFIPKKETENSVIGWKSPSLGIFTWDLHRNVDLTTAEAVSCEHQITWIPGNNKSWRMWMFKGSPPPRSRFATHFYTTNKQIVKSALLLPLSGFFFWCIIVPFLKFWFPFLFIWTVMYVLIVKTPCFHLTKKISGHILYGWVKKMVA